MIFTNGLIHEKSPYLLQHAHNPVNWFPWGNAAFTKAHNEGKPVFLSIGYSTCHWCHVMARECFEDLEVAGILNRYFISIKVDREQRPDIDGIYMGVCQSMTGSGGWPLSIFTDEEGIPFFAGTYFPKETFMHLLTILAEAWQNNRQSLIENGKQLISAVADAMHNNVHSESTPVNKAVIMFRRSFDTEYGGFGNAPKFPVPHNLMFLLRTAPEMAEKTLRQMYIGGIFDHIGGGFSRYSTDRRWLVPHFEKMLYNNALLAMTYLLAYEIFGKCFYRNVAEKIFMYLESEMRSESGGFYSAQDADSGGSEGSFYLFTQSEIEKLLGKDNGSRFCAHYGITSEGNFNGKNIPNLLSASESDNKTNALLPKVYEYRKNRMPLKTDKKILTAWNALAVTAYAMAARILADRRYFDKAAETVGFIEKNLAEGNTIFAGEAGGKHSGPGFLDDYAFYIMALIQMYEASLNKKYLERSIELCDIVWSLFWDKNDGGFFFSGTDNEHLIARIKETADGDMPSGNSAMAYNLSRLSLLVNNNNERFEKRAEMQRRFMDSEAYAYPAGYGFYLYSTMPVKKITCAVKNHNDTDQIKIRSDWAFSITDSPKYPIVNGKTTYYVCKNGICLQPTNELDETL